MACLCALRHGAFRGDRVDSTRACAAGVVTGATMRVLSARYRRWFHGNAFDRRQKHARARDRRRRFTVRNTGRMRIAKAVHDAVRHPSISIAVSFFSAIRDTHRLTTAPPDLQSP